MCRLFLMTVFLYYYVTALVPTRQLNDGNVIPMLALGTSPNTTTLTDTYDSIRKSIVNAIVSGFRHIDTAHIYNTEPSVGAAIRETVSRGLVRREELFITTKLWNDRHARDQVVPGLRASLKNLGLDYVDLYLMHFPMAMTTSEKPIDMDYIKTWRGLEEAHSLGLARSIGVSNFNATQLSRLLANCHVRPAVNEIEANPTYSNAHLISFCKNQGITVMGYSSFGFLVPRLFRRPRVCGIPPQLDDPELIKIAKKYGKTTAQIVLRYEVDRGVIPIAKSKNVNHLQQNINIFDFSLTQEEVETIKKFNKNMKVFNFPTWTNYPNFPFIPW